MRFSRGAMKSAAKPSWDAALNGWLSPMLPRTWLRVCGSYQCLHWDRTTGHGLSVFKLSALNLCANVLIYIFAFSRLSNFFLFQVSSTLLKMIENPKDFGFLGLYLSLFIILETENENLKNTNFKIKIIDFMLTCFYKNYCTFWNNKIIVRKMTLFNIFANLFNIWLNGCIFTSVSELKLLGCVVLVEVHK